MFLIKTEADLIQAFRPRDRPSVEIPTGALHFPLLVRTYRAWSDPQGFRTFLVLGEPNSKRPMGILFERDQGGGKSVAHMCDWCHSGGSSNDIGLLTAEANARRRVGVHVCLDLRCGEKLEERANQTGQDPRELNRQLVERMVRFADSGLGIAFVPAI